MFNNGSPNTLSTTCNKYGWIGHDWPYQLVFINARIEKTHDLRSAHLFDVHSCGHYNGGAKEWLKI
jgi:hypothetical protein